MSKRDPKLLLADIIESIEKIEKYTYGLSFKTFTADDKTVDAVIRNFEIIGEAANRIPEEIKEKYPTTNWFRIKGFRNRIVHDYMGIDYEIVWNIITNDLSKLREEMQGISKQI